MQVRHNIMWNNYHSTWPIDHDDGSCYYHDHHNFLIYGGAKVRAASPAVFLR